MATPDALWSIVIPVKRLALAKTRLAVPPDVRADLALAMALDTVHAALACSDVIVVVAVTDDERAVPPLGALGAIVVADEPDAGLNPALVHGARRAVERQPTSRLAALASDLPALVATELNEVLHAATSCARGCVADTANEGTTLLTASGLDDFVPAFGSGSLARHRRWGASDLTAMAGPSVRRDVDTLDDLGAAAALGIGRHTSAVLARLAHLIRAGSEDPTS